MKLMVIKAEHKFRKEDIDNLRNELKEQGIGVAIIPYGFQVLPVKEVIGEIVEAEPNTFDIGKDAAISMQDLPDKIKVMLLSNSK